MILRLTGKNLKSLIVENVDKISMGMRDDFTGYKPLQMDFNHRTVNHSIGKYANGEIHTNTIEGYFSLLKSGVIGLFHHVSEKCPQRYLTEFDFRHKMRRPSATAPGPV